MTAAGGTGSAQHGEGKTAERPHYTPAREDEWNPGRSRKISLSQEEEKQEASVGESRDKWKRHSLRFTRPIRSSLRLRLANEREERVSASLEREGGREVTSSLLTLRFPFQGEGVGPRF